MAELTLTQASKTILDAVTEGIYVVGPEGEIIYENPASVKMLGWETGELIGRPAYATLHHSSVYGMLQPQSECALHTTLEDGKSRHIPDELFWRKDGTSFSVSFKCSAMRNDANEITGVVLTFRDITEQKKRKNRLKEYEHFFNHSNDFICIADTEGYFDIVNPKFEAELGYTEQELQEAPFFSFIHPDDVAATREEVEKLKRGVVSINFVNRYRKKNGEYIWLEWHSAPDAATGRLYAMARDITEWNQQQEELREAHTFLNTILENIPDMVFVKDAADLRFISVNKAGKAMLGVAHDKEVIGKNDHDFFSKEMADFFIMKDREVLENNAYLKIPEEKISTPEGERWLRTQKIPILDANGKPEYLLGISADITKRKKTEEHLTKSLKDTLDYKEALDASSLVAITNQKGVITYVNDNFCKLSKYSKEELLGQDHRIINSGHHPQAFMRELWATIANGKVWKGELKNRAKDGTIYWVHTTIVPFLNEKGKPYQYLAIRVDISERKKKEEELNKANDLLERNHFEITDSIKYAKRIQDAFIPSMDPELMHLPNAFVVNLPKDMLSGDFHWNYYSSKNNCTYVAAGDCTGHGVPGSLITMLAVQLLEQHIVQRNERLRPDTLLKAIDKDMVSFLNKSDSSVMVNDGMEVLLLRIDHADKKIFFSSAGQPLYHYTNGQLNMYKHRKVSVGGVVDGFEKQFELDSLEYQKGERIYAFSDGYADQFGGAHDKKMLRWRQEDYLTEIQSKSFENHSKLLQSYFMEWIGAYEQVDDVLVVGIEL